MYDNKGYKYTYIGHFLHSKCRNFDSNDDLPSIVRYHYNGKIESQDWRKSNILHRLNKPAKLYYDVNGNLIKEVWYKEGKIHNANGPAILIYKNGRITSKLYYTNGESSVFKNFFTI